MKKYWNWKKTTGLMMACAVICGTTGTALAEEKQDDKASAVETVRTYEGDEGDMSLRINVPQVAGKDGYAAEINDEILNLTTDYEARADWEVAQYKEAFLATGGTEKEFDDGRLDVETEFVFFNSDSSVFEVEVENGRAERPDRDDYAVLTPIKAITYTSDNRTDGNDQNAWIVSKLDGEGEREYEAYWLYKEDILYITEGDHESEVEEQMKRVMDNLREGDDTERYLLSVKEAAPTQN